MKGSHAAAAFAVVILATGCASPRYYGTPPAQTYPQAHPMPSPSYSSSYGVIDSIQAVQANANNGMGAGAVVGGVVGGLLGNQVGGGSGRTVATVAGAIGGAMVGDQVERNNNAPHRNAYQINVRLDNGSYRTIMQDNVADLRVGSRVRIENERVYRY